MVRPASEHPTELELEILKILWDDSPLPVREVRSRLETKANRPLAHSSVITILNIMHRKKFLNRRKEGKSFLFSPKVLKENIAGDFMEDLMSRLFDGSPSGMMLNLLKTADIDSEELAIIQKLIKRKEKEQK